MTGSFYTVLDIDETPYQLFAVWTDSQVEMQFGTLRNRKQFGTDENRLEFIRRLNSIPSVQIDESRISGYPKIRFPQLQSDADVDSFLATIDWAIEVIEGAEVNRTGNL